MYHWLDNSVILFNESVPVSLEMFVRYETTSKHFTQCGIYSLWAAAAAAQELNKPAHQAFHYKPHSKRATALAMHDKTYKIDLIYPEIKVLLTFWRVKKKSKTCDDSRNSGRNSVPSVLVLFHLAALSNCCSPQRELHSMGPKMD